MSWSIVTKSFSPGVYGPESWWVSHTFIRLRTRRSELGDLVLSPPPTESGKTDTIVFRVFDPPNFCRL